ncbi:MAG: Fic family protein [Deltaproteobacteria bacterium]|nr:Fic family protein [Deltaproteobacteria bacterium]
MKTLELFSMSAPAVPATAVWYLTDLAEFKGRQELFSRQAPERLRSLREHALVESAVSSNRIEGVHVDAPRIATVVFGRSSLRSRDEEEIRGYRDALALIHERSSRLPLTEEVVLDLHKMVRGHVWDAGRYKERDGDIIERYPDGRERIRFRTVSGVATPSAMADLVARWNDCLRERSVPALVALAAFNLDFLCIHPFRDGNGRLSRLLLLLQCYHLGFEVGRYISLERLIEANKERYYESLEASSQGWHEGRHDPWPFVHFVLFVLRTAYKEFERRVGEIREPMGAKTDRVHEAVRTFPGEFTLGDLERACPEVSHHMVRRVLRALKASGQVECLGRGPGAQWRKKG